MKYIIGPVAELDYYFDRYWLDRLFWKKIETHRHLSIAAARRTGKSSFMKHIVASQKEGVIKEYVITESANSSQEFFKKVYKCLLATIPKSTKFIEIIKDKVKNVDLKKISITEIEFNSEELNFYEELVELLSKEELSKFPILLFIDEFSQTIENIKNDQGEDAARKFLHKCRELRQSSVIKAKINYVFAGSVGLENLVAKINESKSINDLGTFDIPPLSDEETHLMINAILDGDDIEFASDDRNYFLERLKWYLPFHIQILMSEIDMILDRNGSNQISKDTIDEAFAKTLKNRTYFEHWFSRLRIIFKGNEFSCAKNILNQIAKKESIDAYELSDLFTKYEIEEGVETINILKHDGYISKNDNNTYRFNSPLLQEWWLQTIVI